ncbi:uncharacterized protein LOC142220261 [Haematobia irritans]|uniref:uncharacterized protein LOC142220261 n=1 Tax=Haematobia irritans TaxID=7368 RepID=UPI003F502132
MSTFNDDELVAPAWIDNEFLKKVLMHYENNEEVEIIQFEMSPASKKGDHYASIMFRCKVEYRLGCHSPALQISLIIKTLPVEETSKKREFLMESSLFETEIIMYSEVLPKIEKILAECGEPTKLSPRIYYHALEPQKVIILEDLCVSGYDAVRGHYLSENEIKMCYSKLAKLHAVSYMLGQSDDHKIVTGLQDGYKLFSMPVMNDMWTHGIKHFINMLSSYEEFSIYAEKIKDMKDDIVQACIDEYQAYSLNKGHGDILVLNHGDFHMKNLMFKFNDDRQMEDVIMVDFQISSYGPSNVDLTYSEYLLLSSELRMKRNELMYYYFSEFLRILKKINYDGKLPLKYSQFQISALKYRHHSIYLLCVILPLVIGFFSKSAEELKDVNNIELVENSELGTPYYYTTEIVEEVRKLMPKLLLEGYLD